MNSISILLPVCLFCLADGKAFLESGVSETEASETDMSDMLAMLLEQPGTVDLSEAVRNQHAKDSHAHNQAALQAMFKSLPKNEKGNLGLPAARYALHRLFEHRHRWFVRGLHPKSKTGSEGAGKSHAVGKALQTLTALSDKKGLSLAALAALAGTLDELIQSEVASHLRGFYEARGYPVDASISGEKLKQLGEAYMTVYIAGADFRNNSKEDILEDSKFMSEHTKGWTDTQMWVGSEISEAEKAKDGCKDDEGDCNFDFSESTRVVKKVVERYGHFNDGECHKLKTQLLDIQPSGPSQEKRTGRVTLADFYKAGLSGAWEFNEKADYLRALGALDESTADDPKVIVPNYVSSWVNCLSSSKFYSVCCRNECEDYMKVIEKQIGGPMADPDQIISIVESQSVFTIDPPPGLGKLRHRLVSIAERHHGKVPIHGRLFAQWMHHAFPTTCPYPHEAGKTNPQTPDEWMTDTGRDIKASKDEVQKVVHQAKERPVEQGRRERTSGTVTNVNDAKEEDGGLPWTDVEELLVVRPTQAPQKAGSTLLDMVVTLLEALMVVGLVCAVIWMASQLRQQRGLHHKGHQF